MEMKESIYTECVRRIKLAASEKYGNEIKDKSEVSDEPCWCFSQISEYDDPLIWILDTWVDKVRAYFIFQLDDPCAQEDIAVGFLAMEVAREEYVRLHVVTN